MATDPPNGNGRTYRLALALLGATGCVGMLGLVINSVACREPSIAITSVTSACVGAIAAYLAGVGRGGGGGQHPG